MRCSDSTAARACSSPSSVRLTCDGEWYGSRRIASVQSYTFLSRTITRVESKGLKRSALAAAARTCSLYCSMAFAEYPSPGVIPGGDARLNEAASGGWNLRRGTQRQHTPHVQRLLQ